MAFSRILLRITATCCGKPPRKSSHLQNPVIVTSSRTGIFETLFYGIDNEEKTLTSVNAGQNPPLVFRDKTREVKELDQPQFERSP
ncbi:MAG: serine/threonine-protein phosphatase [Methanoregula sp.]|nr:serine/threonine-protein phosphatase [Methanoregula sp.]